MVDIALKTEIYLWSQVDVMRGRTELSERLGEFLGGVRHVTLLESPRTLRNGR